MTAPGIQGLNDSGYSFGYLATDDAWISHVGQPMVVLPQGRKLGFSLWPEARIAHMVERGPA